MIDTGLVTLLDYKGFTLNGVYTPITTGYLFKEAPNNNLIVIPRRRYFVLDSLGLSYYKEPGGKVLGTIDLSHEPNIVAYHVKRPFIGGFNNFLRIKTVGRIWNLTTESIEDLQKWHNVFKNCKLCEKDIQEVEEEAVKEELDDSGR